MTKEQARQILLRYRPDSVDENDAEITAAVATAQSDPELRDWFEKHCAFQRHMRAQLQNLPVPEIPILPGNIVPGPAAWWRRRGTLAAAAAIIVCAIAASLWVRPAVDQKFDHFRNRMARAVLREYHMELQTGDMTQLRQHLRQNGAPADYKVPEGLKSLPLTGGGVLRWRGKPVSMVCFDRGQQQMVFLFVIESADMANPPPGSPQFSQVSRLMTASWTEGDRSYLLATEATDLGALKQHL